MTGRMDQRVGDPSGVSPIETARRVPKVDRDALGDARGDAQHPVLTRRAGKAPALERFERRSPVDERHRCVAWCPVDDLDELVDEVGPQQPAAMLDQHIDGRFSAKEPLGVALQRRREVLEVGSK